MLESVMGKVLLQQGNKSRLCTGWHLSCSALGSGAGGVVSLEALLQCLRGTAKAEQHLVLAHCWFEFCQIRDGVKTSGVSLRENVLLFINIAIILTISAEKNT